MEQMMGMLNLIGTIVATPGVSEGNKDKANEILSKLIEEISQVVDVTIDDSRTQRSPIITQKLAVS